MFDLESPSRERFLTGLRLADPEEKLLDLTKSVAKAVVTYLNSCKRTFLLRISDMKHKPMPLRTGHSVDTQKDIGLREHIRVTFHEILVKVTADLVKALLDQHLNLIISNEVIRLNNI